MRLNAVGPTILTQQANDAWQMLIDGDFEQGLRQLSSVVLREGTGRYSGMRGIANLLVSNCHEAADDFLKLRRRLRFTPWVGCSLWICGDHEDACADWADLISAANSSDEMYAEGAGALHQAVLLWWASARHNHHSRRNVAERQLTALVRTDMSRQNGLGPVVQFLAAALNSKYPVVESNQLCQAHFYIAAVHLGNDDIGAYRRELLSVLSFGPKYSFPEHHLARYELSRLIDPV